MSARPSMLGPEPPAPTAPAEAAPARLAGIGLWMVAVLAGYALLMAYANRPGEAGSAPATWPDSEGLARDEREPTLLFFAHPRCPCTLASVAELQRLAAQVPGGLHGYVLAYRPASGDAQWEDTPVVRAARSVPGLRLVADVEGRWARAFGVATSGHVLLYDQSGTLAFSGGVTAARAHEGDNRGRDALAHFLRSGEVLEPATAVYGCELLGPHAACSPAGAPEGAP